MRIDIGESTFRGEMDNLFRVILIFQAQHPDPDKKSSFHIKGDQLYMADGHVVLVPYKT